METNWEDERAAFMAGEIGEPVRQLVIGGSEICQGNTIRKGILRDAAAVVRREGKWGIKNRRCDQHNTFIILIRFMTIRLSGV